MTSAPFFNMKPEIIPPDLPQGQLLILSGISSNKRHLTYPGVKPEIGFLRFPLHLSTLSPTVDGPLKTSNQVLSKKASVCCFSH